MIRWPILLTIRFGAFLEPARLRDILHDFALRHQGVRAYYQALEADMRRENNDPFELATVRFGQLFEAAIKTWLDELPTLLPDVISPPDVATD